MDRILKSVLIQELTDCVSRHRMHKIKYQGITETALGIAATSLGRLPKIG
ncbi:hypothetical protein N9Z67_00230 [Rhodopirellula sp.]|nr:hypothetical protein [Rhodopirellula sp.]